MANYSLNMAIGERSTWRSMIAATNHNNRGGWKAAPTGEQVDITPLAALGGA